MKSLQSSEIINELEIRIQKLFESESSGHDFQHIHRVRRVALELSKTEGGDPFVIELIALLHDVGDWKFHDRGLQGQADILSTFLADFDINDDLCNRLITEIPKIGYKGSGVEEGELSLESRIVRDADRLDAIGALGIARCFAYGGNKGLPIFDPDIPIEKHFSSQAYHGAKPPSIHHFFEKLLLLKRRLHTDSAKKLAENRHQFLIQFLQQFFSEWYGDEIVPKQFCLKEFEV